MARYSFSATSDILDELRKCYEEIMQCTKNSVTEEAAVKINEADEKGPARMDTEILSKAVEQSFSSLFTLHIMAVNPMDEDNTQEKTKKEIEDLFVPL